MSERHHIKPLVITMGEPAGIGPELIVDLWKKREEYKLPPFAYVGSRDALLAHDPKLSCKDIKGPDAVSSVFSTCLPVIEIALQGAVEPGILNPENGGSVIAAIDKAVSYVRSGAASAVVTAPIHKAALYGAGFDVPGHTEYLARLCSMPEDASIMMLAAQDLRVVPVTVHIALAEVSKNLTTSKIIHAATVVHHDLIERFGIKKPRLAIAALNPHAGEGGAMGMEEATHIVPAIWALRDEGISVTDPLPADTLFHADARKNYDAVICMYHDQALIPLKTLDFWGGVNITLGLPIIRTSPDHGTALELAGKGVARIESMLAAVRAAEQMARMAHHD